MFKFTKVVSTFFLSIFLLIATNIIAQNKSKEEVSKWEITLKNLIAKKSNFTEYKTAFKRNYMLLAEYNTNVKPLNRTYKISIIENTIEKTSAFVYSNLDKVGSSFFYLNLIFLYDKNKEWELVHEKKSDPTFNGFSIFYKQKKVGFIAKNEVEKQTFISIGNLSNEDIISYLDLEYKLKKEEDFFKVLNSLDTQNTTREDTSIKKDKFNLSDWVNDYLDTSTKIKVKSKDNNGNSKISEPVVFTSEWVTQFDSVMDKWKFDAENNAADVKNLQQYLMLLIGQRVIGFNDMKKDVQSKTNESIIYYAIPNIFMKASTEYIVERNSKNSYCAFYNNKIDKDLSLQAFLAMPSINKSVVPLKVEKAKLVNNAIEKTRYNLYLSDKIAASYFINKNDNSIQVYEPGY